MARISYAELIVVDDIGLLPAGEDEAEALYRLVDAAYDRRSLILTSNLHPGRFDTVFPKGLATAVVDPVLNHACDRHRGPVEAPQRRAGRVGRPAARESPYRPSDGALNAESVDVLTFPIAGW